MAEQTTENGLEKYLEQYQIWNTAKNHFEKIGFTPRFINEVSNELALKRKNEENLTDEQYEQAKNHFDTLLPSAGQSELYGHYAIIGGDAYKKHAEGLVKKVDEDKIIEKLGKNIFPLFTQPVITDSEKGEQFLFNPANVKNEEYKSTVEAHKLMLEVHGIEKSGDPREKIAFAQKYHDIVYGKIKMPHVGIGYLNNLYSYLGLRAGNIFEANFKDKEGKIDSSKIAGYAQACLADAKLDKKAEAYNVLANAYLNAQKAATEKKN
jgi:hypothetical protein